MTHHCVITVILRMYVNEEFSTQIRSVFNGSDVVHPLTTSGVTFRGLYV
jgi:hypothetical protein